MLRSCRVEVAESGWLALSTRRALATELAADVARRVALRLGRLIRSSLPFDVECGGHALHASLELLELAEAAGGEGVEAELLAERDSVANALSDERVESWAEASAAHALLAVSDALLYGFHVSEGDEERRTDRENWDAWFWGAIHFAEGLPWERHDPAKAKEYWTTLLDIVASETARRPGTPDVRYEGAYEGRPPHMACVLVREGSERRKVLRLHAIERRERELNVVVEPFDEVHDDTLPSLIVDVVWVGLMGQSEDLIDCVRIRSVGDHGSSRVVRMR